MAQQGNCKGNREKAAERRLRALELRKGGATYRQIGERLGVSEAQAHRDVCRALAGLQKLCEAEAEVVRTLEIARLDALLVPMMRQALQGNQGAVDRVLRIAERRAKLLGLDAPVRQEVTGPGGGPIQHRDVTELTDDELAAIASRGRSGTAAPASGAA